MNYINTDLSAPFISLIEIYKFKTRLVLARPFIVSLQVLLSRQLFVAALNSWATINVRPWFIKI